MVINNIISLYDVFQKNVGYLSPPNRRKMKEIWEENEEVVVASHFFLFIKNNINLVSKFKCLSLVLTPNIYQRVSHIIRRCDTSAW